MLDFVSIFGLILAAIAFCDRRAWPLLVVMALSWMETGIASVLTRDVLMQLGFRIPIDMSCGFLALLFSAGRREKWALAFVSLFPVLLLLHGLYWLSRYNGLNFWLFYAHSLNGVFLIQLACLAFPGGTRLVGVIRSWVGAFLDSGRWRSGVGLGKALESYRDSSAKPCVVSHRRADEPANRRLYVPARD
jgi:hypothetical protein